MYEGGEGVKNWRNFAYVLNGWSLAIFHFLSHESSSLTFCTVMQLVRDATNFPPEKQLMCYFLLRKGSTGIVFIGK